MLEARNISKKFSGVTALSCVNLTLQPGMVNAIIGENGAGKSTLMKIFSGVYTSFEGEIWLHGKAVKFSSTREAEKAGIAIIHQELNLVPHLSIAENIFLGREITTELGTLSKKSMQEITTKLLKKVNLKTNPERKIAELKVGEQQLVEIAKALYSDASILIMDEPTSAISDHEVDNLFAIIKELKTDGKTIVYISHKFKELFTIADRYIVLRDGATVDSGEMQGASQEKLIQKMTGRDITPHNKTAYKNGKEELLSINNLSLSHPSIKATAILKNISFDLNKGEILGIYGLMGSGRTELMESIFGLHSGTCSGKIIIDNVTKKINRPADAIESGIALVPEDRKLQGLFLQQSVKKNISIAILDKLQKLGLMLSRKKETQLTDAYIKQLSIRTASQTLEVKNLSGGNQQKIVIGKWLAKNPKVLLLDEPTRGIDINAKAEIYRLMKTLASEGMGIIMVSSELPEIMAVSDRVLVMCEGEITADMDISAASEQEILKHAIHKS